MADIRTSSPPAIPALPLDEGRTQALLDAILAVGSALDLQTVLHKIIEASVRLVDARYGALGVIGDDHTLAQFLTVGIDDNGRRRIGDLPRGLGVLGLLVDVPEVLRLDDLTAHPSSYGFPPNHPPMHSFLGVPVRVRGELFAIIYHTEKHGGAAFTEDDERVATAIAAAAGVAIENARLYDEARHREQWLRASSLVTTRVLSGTDTGEVLGIVAAQARSLLGADLAFISLPSNGALVVEVVDGDEADKLRGFRLPDTTSLVGEAYQTRLPVNVPDITTDVRAARFWDDISLPGPALFVPLLEGERVHGVLTATRRAGGTPFDPQAIAMLRAFADQAALALELAERRIENERLSVYADRDRIARDLHDLVIQRLFATGMRLESALPQLAHPEVVEAVVRDSVDDLDTTIREIRTTIYGLQENADRKPLRLRSRLLSVVERIQPMLHHPPSVRFDGLLDTRVPLPTANDLVAVLRESLSNVARHADAEHVDVVVDVRQDEVVLTVVDDGVGIPVDRDRSSGLSNLAERAAAGGGSFSVGPGETGGTVLRWQVPIGG